MVNPKAKGKSGENEACRWLEKNIFNGERQLKPNQNQIFLGCDIFATPFIVEVKRRETLALNGWWIQISKVYKRLDEHNKHFIPVVMFRQNRGAWEFLISAKSLGLENGFVRLTEARFTEWARKFI
jgi:hypothetical protein